MADIVEVIEVGAQVVEVVQVGPPGPAGTTDFTKLENLPDSFPPERHGESHKLGSSDAISAEDIGAAPAVPRTGNMMVYKTGISTGVITVIHGLFQYAGVLAEKPFYTRTFFNADGSIMKQAQLRWEPNDQNLPSGNGHWQLLELTAPGFTEGVAKYVSAENDSPTPDLVGSWSATDASLPSISVGAQFSTYVLHNELSPVAGSGNYADLQGKPSLSDLDQTEGTLTFIRDTTGRTLANYINQDATLIPEDKRVLLKSLGTSPGPVIDRVVNPTRSNASLVIANGATVGSAVTIANRTALLAPIAVAEDIYVDAYCVRISGSGWTQTGLVQMALYEHSEQGLPGSMALSASQPLNPLWRSFEISTSASPNTWFAHALAAPVRLPAGLYWIAFLNLCSSTQNLAAAGTRNNLLFDLLGANIVITGTAPEGLNFFVPAADPNLPLSLGGLVFEPNINTASTTTLRYRVSAPWMGLRYVQPAS